MWKHPVLFAMILMTFGGTFVSSNPLQDVLNEQARCKSVIGSLDIEILDTYCPRNQTNNYALCDAHCILLHGANYGKCIDWPRNMTALTIATLTGTQMCACDYMNPRPAGYLPPLPSFTVPVAEALFSVACSSVLGINILDAVCNNDCICVHGFASGTCNGETCLCNGLGPLNWASQPS